MNDAAELSFDRAEYAGVSEGASAAPCGQCGGSLTGQYWTLHGKVLCESCRGQAEQVFGTARSTASLGKALLLGGLTALGCGIAYAVFVALTDYQLALATIGIAFLVATVVRRASQGLGGLRFQVLAVCLTYFASAMGYAPAVWSAMRGDSKDEQAQPGAPSTGDEASLVPPESKPASSAPAAAAATSSASGVELIVAIAFIVGVILAAPFLSITQAPIGFFIVLFGLWEAWKRTKAADITVEGPFRVEPSAGIPLS